MSASHDGVDVTPATHPREQARVWIEPVAKQLDEIVAIGELYHFDRFTAPANLWHDLQHRYPQLLGAGWG